MSVEPHVWAAAVHQQHIQHFRRIQPVYKGEKKNHPKLPPSSDISKLEIGLRLHVQCKTGTIRVKAIRAGRGNGSENHREESHSCANREGFAASVKCTAQQRQPGGVEGNVISIQPVLHHPQTLLQSSAASLAPVTSLCCLNPLTLE